MPLPVAELEIRTEQQAMPEGECGEIVARMSHNAGLLEKSAGRAERIADGSSAAAMRTAASPFSTRADHGEISGGFIYPAEPENVIATHLAVVEVAVFAVPIRDGRRRARWRARSRKLRSRRRNSPRPAPFLSATGTAGQDGVQPRSPVQTPVGKIKRKELREPFWAGRERQVAGNRRTRAAASATMSQGVDSFHRRPRVL